MATQDKILITKDTIERICGEFGFVHETDAEGHVFVAIGTERIEVKFREDGTLPRGRNRFLSAARKTSAEFATAYPPTKASRVAVSGRGKSPSSSLPKLDRTFLMKYSEEEIIGLKELLPGVLSAKLEERERRERMADLEERNGKLRTAFDALKAVDIPVPNSIEEEISRNDKELADLRVRNR